MNWVTGLLVFIVLWWLVLFTVLPWGSHRARDPESGHEPGAPARPMLVRKFLITTAIAGVLFVVAYFVISSDIISFREAVGS